VKLLSFGIGGIVAPHECSKHIDRPPLAFGGTLGQVLFVFRYMTYSL
jgi:hypothetical protein